MGWFFLDFDWYFLGWVVLFLDFGNTKNRNQKNTQTPTGIMISTKKQFHPLGENQQATKPLNSSI
ncbi:hypothetical protein BAZOLSSOX_1645 [uncultured Gammaproteobacteria bacterium]|nr:hypothetical protein BAZOLSSOX_1645 [uncultured Gammaproteobacteria bacterium]